MYYSGELGSTLCLEFNAFMVARKNEPEANLELTPSCHNLTAAATSMAAIESRWHPAGRRGRWGTVSGGDLWVCPHRSWRETTERTMRLMVEARGGQQGA